MGAPARRGSQPSKAKATPSDRTGTGDPRLDEAGFPEGLLVPTPATGRRRGAVQAPVRRHHHPRLPRGSV